MRRSAATLLARASRSAIELATMVRLKYMSLYLPVLRKNGAKYVLILVDEGFCYLGRVFLVFYIFDL